MSAARPLSNFGSRFSDSDRDDRQTGGQIAKRSGLSPLERPLGGYGGGSGGGSVDWPQGDDASAPTPNDQSRDCHTTSSGIPIGRRAAPRLRLAIPARLVSLYGSHRCILIDVSATGAQVGMEAPLARSENAILEIAGKELFCDIVRVARGPHGGTNGVMFDPALEDQEVLDIRHFSERYESDELKRLRSEVRAWVEGSA